MIVQAHGMSMFPYIQSGDFLKVKPASDSSTLTPGDICLLELDTTGEYMAHRFLGSSSLGAPMFKGDRTKYSDEELRLRCKLIGKVVGRFNKRAHNEILKSEIANSPLNGYLSTRFSIPQPFSYSQALHKKAFPLIAELSKKNHFKWRVVHRLADKGILAINYFLRSYEQRAFT